ncbi:MAG TPA: dTMP kinase [Bacteriovoracaceae bacterium]|nr:dTMP kinase [Bacteriovoracaceae bacterium]
MNRTVFQPPMTPESLFLSLEGIEGSGKTTQLKAIQTFLEAKGMRCLVLREPGGTAFGEKLRDAVLTSAVPLNPLAECHLFLASRAQLLQEKILPFLLEKPKSVVILDRYMDSTLAYQGKARRLGFETVLSLHQHHPLCLVPHRTYFLDISLETSLDRQKKRGQSKDYFESQEAEFHMNLIDGYREVAKTFPDRVCTLNAEASEAEVTKMILSDLQRILP